ncbi:DUF6211 family protein [Streptomyces sp. NBC_00134]|uniref:DUF6211 family protein n=1 Tax=Streptomyces sp. NBC_00134 TaxID=2975663 RepID=UPI002F919DFA
MVSPRTLEVSDLVRLRPGNPQGTDPRDWLMVVDLVEHLPGVFEVWHQPDHPDHQDWAAAITAADVAEIIRADADIPEPLTEESP